MKQMEKSGRMAWYLLLLLVPIGLLQHTWYWQRLPDSVATHFGPGGQPDAWMPRTQAVLVQAGFQVVFPFFLQLLGRLSAILPISMVNIPHREYWLAPERRQATLGWVYGMLSCTGVAMSLLMLGLSHLTFQANITHQPLQMKPFFFVLSLFLAAVFSLVFLSFRRFGQPPKD
jgi:uncharacterized membrane protein